MTRPGLQQSLQALFYLNWIQVYPSISRRHKCCPLCCEHADHVTSRKAIDLLAGGAFLGRSSGARRFQTRSDRSHSREQTKFKQHLKESHSLALHIHLQLFANPLLLPLSFWSQILASGKTCITHEIDFVAWTTGTTAQNKLNVYSESCIYPGMCPTISQNLVEEQVLLAVLSSATPRKADNLWEAKTLLVCHWGPFRNQVADAWPGWLPICLYICKIIRSNMMPLGHPYSCWPKGVPWLWSNRGKGAVQI